MPAPAFARPAAAALLVSAFAAIAGAASAEVPTGSVDLDACRVVRRIEVDKSERTLRAFCEDDGVLVMRVALGRSRGPKRRLGDLRTPEGTYRIAGDFRPSRFTGFIPLDYPSRNDAAEAVVDGRISPATWLRIHRARQAGRLPPQDTRLGGHLGIHGEGRRWRGWSRKINWTGGCIAVTDEQLETLRPRLAPGVPVQIFP